MVEKFATSFKAAGEEHGINIPIFRVCMSVFAAVVEEESRKSLLVVAWRDAGGGRVMGYSCASVDHTCITAVRFAGAAIARPVANPVCWRCTEGPQTTVSS